MIEHRNVEEITETKIGIITASDHSPVTLKIKLQGESFEKGTCQGTSSVSARWAPGRMRSGLALRRSPIRGPMVWRVWVHGGPRVRTVARAGTW